MIDVPHGVLEDGEGFEAEEVELDESGFFDFGLGVLGDDFPFCASEDGDIVPERSFGDDDTGGVHPGLAEEIFDLQGGVVEELEFRVAVDEGLELRAGGDVEFFVAL